jgi:hypothetical protein
MEGAMKDFSEALKVIASVAGIGGVALFVLWMVFSEVIRKNIFPTISKTHAYYIIRLVLVLTWLAVVLGIAAYTYVNPPSRPAPDPPKPQTSAGAAQVEKAPQGLPKPQPREQATLGVNVRDAQARLVNAHRASYGSFVGHGPGYEHLSLSYVIDAAIERIEPRVLRACVGEILARGFKRNEHPGVTLDKQYDIQFFSFVFHTDIQERAVVLEKELSPPRTSLFRVTCEKGMIASEWVRVEIPPSDKIPLRR